MNRIDRLLALLIFLQSRRFVLAQEISERFSTSMRTVYRDIRALQETGVPVIFETGRGYSIQEGYHLPPVMFSRQEATALFTATKMARKLTDLSVQNNLDSVLEKVKAVIRYSDKEFIEAVENQILILHPTVHNPEEFPNNFLPKIQKALVEKVKISIKYMSPYKSITEDRKIEPVGLCFYGGRWHLVAFCLLRNEYRDFRLDRIKSLYLTDEKVVSEHPALSEYFPLSGNTSEYFPVVLHFKKPLKPSIAEQKYYYGFMKEVDMETYIEMTFFVNSAEWIANWILNQGSDVSIHEPHMLVEFIKQRVAELFQLYNSN